LVKATQPRFFFHLSLFLFHLSDPTSRLIQLTNRQYALSPSKRSQPASSSTPSTTSSTSSQPSRRNTQANSKASALHIGDEAPASLSVINSTHTGADITVPEVALIDISKATADVDATTGAKDSALRKKKKKKKRDQDADIYKPNEEVRHQMEQKATEI
jgi:pyruvate/2-oxoglutarate dehydrogenase complex dihydrolipoamide acyltransferase (E2) component